MSIKEQITSSKEALDKVNLEFRSPNEGDASETSITLETSFRGFCVQAKLNDQGTITQSIIHKSMSRYRKDLEEELVKEGFNLNYKKSLIQFFYLILCSLVCLTKNIVVISIIFGFLFLMMYTDGINAFPQWIALAIMSFKNKKMRKYHAAEHMALSAYEKYKRIPTIEEVKKEDRFSPICGSNILSENAFLSLIASLFITLAIVGCAVFCYNILPKLEDWIRLVLLGMGILLFILVARQTLEYIARAIEYGFSSNKLSHILQRPFVGKAGNTEINVAIAALEAYETFEKEIILNSEEYMIKKITFDMNKSIIHVLLFNDKTFECSFEEYSEVITNNAMRATKGDTI